MPDPSPGRNGDSTTQAPPKDQDAQKQPRVVSVSPPNGAKDVDFIRVEASAAVYHMTTDYSHSRLNQAIPEDEFKPQAGTGVRSIPLERLTNGYTKRFLNVNDGSGGRMSVRWGMKGDKGMKGSGLN